MAKFVYIGQGDEDRKTHFTLRGDEVVRFRRGEETEVDEAKSPDHAHLARKLRGNGHFQEVKLGPVQPEPQPTDADGVE